MSLYQLHRCIWDQIRASEVKSGAAQTFDVSRYELSAEERKAFENKDVGALYELGLHPVLLNAFARVSGFARNDYRKMLEPYAVREQRRARWQR